MISLKRQCAAEAIGSALLAATVVGSGIMAERLAAGNVAVALLGNTGATVCILYVLISIFGPISGAHFNPAVSLAMCIARRMSWRHLPVFAFAQVTAMIVGVWLAHAMFELSILQFSTKVRSGWPQGLAEAVAMAGLLLTIFGSDEKRAPLSVALYIGAAYWFTASTSFANPAITLARMMSDSFAGIRPADVPMFIICQIGAALLAAMLLPRLFTQRQAPGS